MTAWNGARSRTKVYGWVDPTVNGSTSTHSNSPVANDAYSNRFELNQAVVYVERLPDTVAPAHAEPVALSNSYSCSVTQLAGGQA